MLKRKMLDKLIAWKQKAGGREALLIEGARRVGKKHHCRGIRPHSVQVIYSHRFHTFAARRSRHLRKTSVMTLTHFSCCCLRITASDCTSVNR